MLKEFYYKLVLASTLPIILRYIYIKLKEKKKIIQEKEHDIKIFDLDNIKTGDNIFIVGRRNTGKTTLINKILKKKDTIPVEFVVSPTESLERIYNKIHINGLIYKTYKSEILQRFIQNQIDNINSHIIEDNECFIILDNCL